VRFQATLELHGKTATGFEVPPEVVEALGGGKGPPVRVTQGFVQSIEGAKRPETRQRRVAKAIEQLAEG
jgi:Bacteriocin-protection, YdeI or OmpD-Associated